MISALRILSLALFSMVLSPVLVSSALAESLANYDPRNDMGLPSPTSDQIRQAMEYGDMLLAKTTPENRVSMTGEAIPWDYVAVERRTFEASTTNEINYCPTCLSSYFYRGRYPFGKVFLRHYGYPERFHRFEHGFAGNFNQFSFKPLR